MIINNEESFFNWYNKVATPDDIALMERVENFSGLFEDMLFKSGTATHELIEAQRTDDSGNVITFGDTLAGPLEGFNYSCFRYKAEEPEHSDGFFDVQNSLLCVPLDADDSTVLHEMIHLHESVINDLPMYYHDMLYWALYQQLKDKIPQLDTIITSHAHIVTGKKLYREGGTHDILFLLKSFDLDIKMGYPLGTVFAYGRTDDLKNYDYIRDEPILT